MDLKNCDWRPFDENEWEEVCETHSAPSQNIEGYKEGRKLGCPQWRCKYCGYITGSKWYAECPGTTHILFKLATKVTKGEPIHVQKSRQSP